MKKEEEKKAKAKAKPIVKAKAPESGCKLMLEASMLDNGKVKMVASDGNMTFSSTNTRQVMAWLEERIAVGV